MVVIALYITQGRPVIDINRLDNVPLSTKFDASNRVDEWRSVFNLAIKTEDDHIAKVICEQFIIYFALCKLPI